MKKILLILICSTYAVAYTPTADGLLRNASNLDVSGKTVIASYTIESISLNDRTSLFYKFYLSDSGEFCPLQYSDGTFSQSGLISLNCFRVSQIPNLPTEQAMLYSTIAMLLKNNSTVMIKTLNKRGVAIKSNGQLKDYKYQQLLSSYRDFLSDGGQHNPLEGKSASDKAAIEATLAKGLFKKDELVSREKRYQSFYWKIDAGEFSALFSNDSHQILQYNLVDGDATWQANFKKYMVMANSFEHPESFNLKGPNRQINLKVGVIQLVDDSAASFSKRIEKYRKDLISSDIPALF